MALKILLADDSMTAQNLGKKILTDAGYDVITVSNGAAAVRKIAEAKPQVCILDIYMPGYTGLEVCARIKNSAQTSRIPVLLTVGKMEPYKPEEGARVRADGVIVKPFEATELLRAVQRFSARNHGSRPAEPVLGPTPLGPGASVEKTVRLTREQIQQMMDPDSQRWRENSVNRPLEVPSELASAPMFGVDDVLSTLAATPQESSPSNGEPAALGTVAITAAAPAFANETVAVEGTKPQAPDLDVEAVSSAAAALPGFVDYVIAAESAASESLPAIPAHVAVPQLEVPPSAIAVEQPNQAPAAPLSETDSLPGAGVPEVTAPAETAAKTIEPAAEKPAEPSAEDTQKLDPDVLAAVRRASLAAEISQRMDEEAAAAPPASATAEVVLEKTASLAISEEGADRVEEISATSPQGTVPSTDNSGAKEIPAVDANLEMASPVRINSTVDPNLQVPESDQGKITAEAGLEPTSRSAESESATVTPDPDLTAYEPGLSEAPKNGTAPHVDAPDFAIAASPSSESDGRPPDPPMEAKLEPWNDVPEEIAAALDVLGTQPPAAGATGTVVPITVAQNVSACSSRQRCWVAEEIAVPETESTVSLLDEMQRSKSLREQKPAEVAPAVPEATVRDDQNSPDNKFVPGAGGTTRSVRDVAPASELAAAMAAAFGGALPSSDLARAEATQPISEEVRRFALGDAYKPKPRGFSGAAIQDAEEIPGAGASINELRIAKAVNRAIDRLKPQIVAEILKELKAIEE